MLISSDELGRFRPYLRFLARVCWDRRLQHKIDPSDVVQQALLQAHANLAQFKGSTDAEMAAWLRQILANVMIEQQRHFARDKRNVHREQSIEKHMAESSRRMSVFVADQSSPSERVEYSERALQLTTAMEALPKDQQEVIVLHYWQGLSIVEISQLLGRSTSAIGGLVHRGLFNLRKNLKEI